MIASFVDMLICLFALADCTLINKSYVVEENVHHFLVQ